MSNHYDKPGSTFSGDCDRYGLSAPDAEPPALAEANLAPNSNAAFAPSRRAQTVAVKPGARETQILTAPDYNALLQEGLVHDALAHDAATSGAPHPTRRATDLNGAPETAASLRTPTRLPSAFHEPSNDESSRYESPNDALTNYEVGKRDEANIEYSKSGMRTSRVAPKPQVSPSAAPVLEVPPVNSSNRVEYFLEHILLRHFIQPPSLGASQWREEQREEAYNQQTLELFRLRLRLVTGLAMIMLLFHTLLYIYLSPDDTPIHSVIYLVLIAICIATRHLSQKLSSVDALRKLCLWCYALFALGGALIVSVVGRGQMFVLGGHNHILLTTLLLPFAAAECFFIGSMVIASLAVSGFITFVPHQREMFLSQVFTLCTTAAFTVFVAYFQNALRRRAFDSAFDAMCSMARYQNMSLRDTLTGGHNRRYLMQTLETEIARATRFARPISLILFDLDNFKGVNDTLGHAAGDQVLVEVWNATTKAVRNVDTPARYGGDEFAIVLPEAAEDAAHEIASRLRTTACAHLLHCFGADSPQSKVTLSVGIVTLRPHDVISAEQLLFMADTQLYAAKKAGKNCIA